MLTECYVANQNHLDVRALTYLDFPTSLGLFGMHPTEFGTGELKRGSLLAELGEYTMSILVLARCSSYECYYWLSMALLSLRIFGGTMEHYMVVLSKCVRLGDWLVMIMNG
jgi:hypothetical protein